MTSPATGHGPEAANFDFVTPWLAVGGDLAGDDAHAHVQLVELVAWGVTHVLDTRLECNDAGFFAQHAPQVRYAHLGVDDAGQKIPAAWFDAVIDHAAEALSVPGSVLLTHCHMGINRGPSAGFAVLLACGWSPTSALDAIRSARPIAAVGYAEDALDWHHARCGTSPLLAARERQAVAAWRAQNGIDVGHIIRTIRQAESAGLTGRRFGAAAA